MNDGRSTSACSFQPGLCDGTADRFSVRCGGPRRIFVELCLDIRVPPEALEHLVMPVLNSEQKGKELRLEVTQVGAQPGYRSRHSACAAGAASAAARPGAWPPSAAPGCCRGCNASGATACPHPPGCRSLLCSGMGSRKMTGSPPRLPSPPMSVAPQGPSSPGRSR